MTTALFPSDLKTTDFTIASNKVTLNPARVAPATVSSATAPLSAVLGQVWYDTGATPPVFKIFNGTTWDIDSVVNASTTAIGIVELADTTETGAGTDATRAITPAGLASALNASGAGTPNALQQAVGNAASLTGIAKSTASATPPSPAVAGDRWYNTTTGIVSGVEGTSWATYDGATWKQDTNRKPLYARASMSANQTGVVAGTFTTVKYDTTVANDIFTIPTAGNITITKAGRYRLFSQIHTTHTYDSGAIASLGSATTTVFVNGVYKEQGLKFTPTTLLNQTNASQVDFVTIEYIADFAVGDVINIRGYLAVNAPNTYLTGTFNATTSAKLTMNEV
jgi:hypothetical protein